jgi:uncharacterized membrane protein (DUF106 family)
MFILTLFHNVWNKGVDWEEEIWLVQYILT